MSVPFRGVLRGVLFGALQYAMLWAPPARAAGVAGTSVPGAGGVFAGPAEPGALGLHYNPAAAIGGDHPELLVDVGLFYRSLEMDLDAWNRPLPSRELAPQPSLAVALPLGRVGLGLTFQVPYVRGGENDPTHPVRFFSKASTLQLLQGELMVAGRVHPRLLLGAGLRVGQLTYRSDKAIDTGASLNAALDPSPPLPIGDPLLEGEQRLGPLTGVGLSWAAGATLRLPADIEIHLAARPPWQVRVVGGVVQEPSLDLNTEVTGDAAVVLGFPAHVSLAGRIPAGPVALIPELEYVGWSRAANIRSEVSDLSLASSDPLFNSVLVGAGLSEPDFVTSAEGVDDLDLGWNDIVIPGLAVQWQARSDLALRTGLWYCPAAMPDEVATPSNVDFTTVTVRLGGAWQPAPFARFALGVDRLFSPARHVTTSPAGAGVPSGNGTYSLGVWRLGLTAQWFLPN